MSRGTQRESTKITEKGPSLLGAPLRSMFSIVKKTHDLLPRASRVRFEAPELDLNVHGWIWASRAGFELPELYLSLQSWIWVSRAGFEFPELDFESPRAQFECPGLDLIARDRFEPPGVDLSLQSCRKLRISMRFDALKLKLPHFVWKCSPKYRDLSY